MEQERHLTLLVSMVVDEVMAALERAGAFHLEGLEAPVQVALDDRGAPHIRAGGESDLYRAQGYLTAQDRLWQMDLLRRIAAGRAAEILGPPLIESDKHFLTYRFVEVAALAVAGMRKDVAASVEAYAAGVNARIARFRREGWPWEFALLAYEPEPWTPRDTVLVLKLQAEALSSSWLNDILREQFVDLPEDARRELFDEASPLDVIVFGGDESNAEFVAHWPGPALAEAAAARVAQRAEPAIGEAVARKRTRAGALRLASLYGPNRAVSNNWVVSGAHTASGAPILANDPHLQVAVPGIWHMAHLVCDGLDVAGVTIPGVPGILIGHNARVAWGVTNTGADVQDLYWQRDGAASAGGQAITSTDHVIRVRRSPGAYDEVPFTTRATPHGPIVFEAHGDVYALSWPALDPSKHELQGFHDLNRAQDLDGVRAALEIYAGPPQNFVFACQDGRIGAQIAGCVIERQQHAPGLPRDGTAVDEPAPRLLPFDRLPSVLDPESGVIATANNRTVGLTYPYLIAHEWAAPYRARRIFDLLRSRPKGDVAFSLAIQADTYAFADAVFVTEILRMARYRAVSDARWRAMIAIFGDWDGSAGVDSVATTVSVSMRQAFGRRVLATVLDAERIETYLRWDVAFRFIDRVLSDRPAHWLPAGFADYEDLILGCFDEAAAELAARFGTDVATWTWGRVAPPVAFVHPLATLAVEGVGSLRFERPNGTGGSGPTVNAGGYVSMRFVADLADWDETRLGLPLGQSGDVRSPHFADQFPGWSDVAPARFAFGERAWTEAQSRFELRGGPSNRPSGTMPDGHPDPGAPATAGA